MRADQANQEVPRIPHWSPLRDSSGVERLKTGPQSLGPVHLDSSILARKKASFEIIMADIKYKDREIDEARALYEHVVDSSDHDTTIDVSSLGRAYFGLGLIEAQHGKLPKAAEYFHQAMKWLQKAGQESLSHLARYNLSLILDQLGKTKKALSMLVELARVAVRDNDRQLQVLVQVSIGFLEIRKGKIHLGWKHLLKAKNTALLSGNVQQIVFVLSLLVNVALTLKKYHLAEYFAYYLQLFILNGDQDEISVYLTLSRLYRETRRIYLSQEYLEKALALLSVMPTSRNWISYYLEQARSLLDENWNYELLLEMRREQALRYLGLARSLALQWGSRRELSEILLEITHIELEQGDLEKALKSVEEVILISRKMGFKLLESRALLLESTILGLMEYFDLAEELIEKACAIARQCDLDFIIEEAEKTKLMIEQERKSQGLYKNCLENSGYSDSLVTMETIRDYIEQAKTIMLYFHDN